MDEEKIKKEIASINYEVECRKLNTVINNMQCQIDALKKVIENLVYSQGIEDARRDKLQ